MKRLSDRDAVDHMALLSLAVRLGPLLMIGLCGVEFYFFGSRFIWFILPDIALTALIIWGTNWFVEGAARAAGSILLPSAKGSPTPQQEWLASNALIDMYHREGRREPLKEELGRLARRHARTAAGTSAQRRLQELLEEESAAVSGPEGVT